MFCLILGNIHVFLYSGYFSQISTLADVQENVMRYLHVMSRPKVIDHEHDTVWTEAYVDSAVSVSVLYLLGRNGIITSSDCPSYESLFSIYICTWVTVHAFMYSAASCFVSTFWSCSLLQDSCFIVHPCTIKYVCTCVALLSHHYSSCCWNDSSLWASLICMDPPPPHPHCTSASTKSMQNVKALIHDSISMRLFFPFSFPRLIR